MGPEKMFFFACVLRGQGPSELCFLWGDAVFYDSGVL